MSQKTRLVGRNKPEKVTLAIALLETGKSIRQVAKETQLSKTTVTLLTPAQRQKRGEGGINLQHVEALKDQIRAKAVQQAHVAVGTLSQARWEKARPSEVTRGVRDLMTVAEGVGVRDFHVHYQNILNQYRGDDPQPILDATASPPTDGK